MEGEKRKLTFLMKIVLVGDINVGKTTFFNQHLGGSFQSRYLKTVGQAMSLRTSVIEDRHIKYQILILAGHPKFKAKRSVFFLGALGALVMFDVTTRKTFDNLDLWIKEIWDHNGKGILPLVLLGNKIDLRSQFFGSISLEEANEYCTKLSGQMVPYGFDIPYIEISAKTGFNINIDKILEPLGKACLKFHYQL